MQKIHYYNSYFILHRTSRTGLKCHERQNFLSLFCRIAQLFCQNQSRKCYRFLTCHLGIPYTENSQYIYSTLHYSIQAVLVCYSEHSLSILPLFITPLLRVFPPLSLSLTLRFRWIIPLPHIERTDKEVYFSIPWEQDKK